MRRSERWVRFADRHRRALLAIGALLAVLGAVGTARLYGDLRPDMAELLPSSSHSAADLEAVTARVGGFAELSIVLSGADPVALELFADDLADRLSQAPKELVRWVEYRVDDATAFYRPRLLLFPEKGELEQIRDALRARVGWEDAARAGKARGPAPDVEAVVDRVAGARGQILGRFPTGYTLGEVPGRKPGERMTILAMIVRLGSAPDDYGKVVALKRAVERAVADLDPAKYAPGLTVA
jgi:hypothetical protein